MKMKNVIMETRRMNRASSLSPQKKMFPTIPSTVKAPATVKVPMSVGPKVAPAPAASSATQAILAASAGSQIMPATPATVSTVKRDLMQQGMSETDAGRAAVILAQGGSVPGIEWRPGMDEPRVIAPATSSQPIPDDMEWVEVPDAPVTSPEAAVVTQVATGSEAAITAPKSSGGGGAMIAAGAGAGFFLLGPIGALVGAVAAGVMSKKKATPTGRYGHFGAMALPMAMMLVNLADQGGSVPGDKLQDARNTLAKGLTGKSGTVTSVTRNPDGTYAFTFSDGSTAGSKLASGFHNTMTAITKTAVPVGITAAAMIAGGAGAAALTGAVLSAGRSQGAAEATPTEEAIQATTGPTAPTVTPVDSSGQPLAPKGGAGKVIGPIAGAGAGLLVAGPIGAVVGLAAGFFATRK